MLNNYDVYVAFNQCKKIYGLTEVHVQLIAKQLGVLAGEVVDVIDANSSLYSTRMNPANSNYINSVSGNEYPGMIVTGITAIPYLSTTSIIREADNGGTIVLTPSTGTFTNSNSTANWTVDVGLTGLTFASVNNATATKTLTFTGTAKPGTISIKCKASGMTSGIASDTLYFEVPEINFDYSTLSAIEARVTVNETDIGTAEDDIDDLEAEVFPAITVVDLDTDGDYTILSTDVHIVTTANDVGGADSLDLPASTGSGKRYILSNQDASNACVATADGTDTINGEATKEIAVLSTIIVVDWSKGKWLTI